MHNLRNKIYYTIRPILPRRFQVFIRRLYIRLIANRHTQGWPIDPDADEVPKNWTGWPDNKRFAFVLTHDVDTAKGYSRIKELADLEIESGFRSSFNFVARRYDIEMRDLQYLTEKGFEIGVHGVYHDGRKFDSYAIFKERADIINQCLSDWNAVGFRAPSMLRNLEWIGELDIEYDSSTFDTDPFEPQSDGVRTIFPYRIENKKRGSGFIEIPYTLPQDFTLFVLLQEDSIRIWEKKLDWIAECGGMALLNVHPDYMYFGKGKRCCDEYPAERFQELLNLVQSRYQGQYWNALPRDVARFWNQNIHTGESDLLNKKENLGGFRHVERDAETGSP